MDNRTPTFAFIAHPPPEIGELGGPEDIPALEQAALFLDFDGTLVEIAERPDDVVLPPRSEDLLDELHEITGGAVAIVSGRGLAEIERMLPRFEGLIVGSHGAERRDGGRYETVIGEHGAAFDEARAGLGAWAAERDGVLLEEKPVSLVLHYRQAPEMEDACKQRLDEAAQTLPGFAVRPSKMALELMPERVSKLEAVRSLTMRWAERTGIAIGDDHTDEGMFTAVQDRGGHGVKVGEGRSVARYRVRDVAAVHAGLHAWLHNARRAACRDD